MKPITWLICTCFCVVFSFQTMVGQEISKENYRENYDTAVAAIRSENYEKATEISYRLIEFLKEDKTAFRDSTNYMLSKVYYNLTNIYLFNDFDLSITYADSTIAEALRECSSART